MQFFLQLNSPLGPGFGPNLNLTTIPAGPVTPSTITVAQAIAGIVITVPNNTTSVVITSSGNPTCVITFAAPTTTQDPCLSNFGIATVLPLNCNIGTLTCTVVPPGQTTTTTSTSTSTSTTSTTSSTSTTTSTTINACAEAICEETYEGYGYLYNWYAIFGAGAQTNEGRNNGGIVNTNQPTSLPNTWKVPTNTDWTTLTTYLGGESVAGGKLKTICTTPFNTNNGLWNTPNFGATNEVNWAGVPGGSRGNDGVFYNIGNGGYWWSSTEFNISNAGFIYLNYLFNNTNISSFGKSYGFSVRLVRPATLAEQSLTDGTTSNSGLLPHYYGNEIATLPGPIVNRKVYVTVKIGNQIWTAQNLVEETYNNGTFIPEVTNNTTWSTLTTGARCKYNNTNIQTNGSVELCNSANITGEISMSSIVDSNIMFKTELENGIIEDTLTFSNPIVQTFGDSGCNSLFNVLFSNTGTTILTPSINSDQTDLTGAISAGISYKIFQAKVNGVIINSDPFTYIHPTTGNIYTITGFNTCLQY
jgi:uncharacterized protein (TIGR02145 family)